MKPIPNDYLQHHSYNYLKMALRTDRLEPQAHPDGYGRQTGRCGDTIEMFIQLRNDRIKRVTYSTDGCLNTHACSNTVAHLVEGQTITQAWEITPDEVITYLETLPQEENHCAELAVGTLYRALVDTLKNKKSPWRKLYPAKGGLHAGKTDHDSTQTK